METVKRERLKTRKELEKDHPLNRKFSSMEEASKAKIEYIMRDKPESYFTNLAKKIQEIRDKESI